MLLLGKKARTSDVIALGLLVLAVVAFCMFQALAVSYTLEGLVGEETWISHRGYQVWVGTLDMVRNPAMMDALDWILCSGIPLSMLTVMVSPFLIGVLSRSRFMWWAAMMVSSMPSPRKHV